MPARKAGACTSAAGFSLLELLVAMALTLLVSGTVFALLSSGEKAFRREPALTDRQQNIRAAMDLLQRDLGIAGSGVGSFTQVFRPGLDGFGPAAFPSVIKPGERVDAVEVWGDDGQCPSVRVCKAAGINVAPAEELPACYKIPGLVWVGNDLGTVTNGLHYAVREQGGAMGCGASDQLKFDHGDSALNPSSGFCGPADPPCQKLVNVATIRYEIAPDSDGQPALWRSPTGRTDGSKTNVAPPGGNWQVVARGIEDLQVEYRNGSGTWSSTPGTVTCTGNCSSPTLADYNTIVREVRVTLSARALAPRLAGERTSAAGNAVRGQLVSVTAPIAARIALANATPQALWR